MQTTTQRLIREDFVGRILALTPSYPEYGYPWKRVRALSDVPGSEIRNFLLYFLPGQPVSDGLYGDGIEHVASIRVYANYQGLQEDEDGPLIDEDFRQLWLTLETRVDPIVPGLISVQPGGPFIFEDDTPGHLWGYHQIDIHYLAPDTP